MSTPRSFTGERCDLLRLSEDYGDVGRATLLEDEWKRGKKRRLREVYVWVRLEEAGWGLGSIEKCGRLLFHATLQVSTPRSKQDMVRTRDATTRAMRSRSSARRSPSVARRSFFFCL